MGGVTVGRRVDAEGIRWGLCCQFLDAPIKFRTATHRYVSTLPPAGAAAYLQGIARDNAAALAAAILRCRELEIGAFRVNSQILPLGTHPVSGYTLETLDEGGSIRAAYAEARARAVSAAVRLSFHPDQFVVLNSERPEVVAASVAELEFQTEIASLIGADTIVVHAGARGNDRDAALERLARGVERLSLAARGRLAIENDDRYFTPADLLPVCRRLDLPLVYDAHHHRCHPDGMTVNEATDAARETWSREPWLHISSPRDGWGATNPRAHAEYVDPTDFPDAWFNVTATVDVEAKAKERAVVRLMSDVRERAAARK